MNKDETKNRLLEIRKELSDIKIRLAQPDPLLAEITKQVCSTGICLAKGSNPKNMTAIGNLPKGAWLQFKPEGRMYQRTEIKRNWVTIKDGEGNLSQLPVRQFVYPLEMSSNTSKLPICSAPEKKKVEQCILDVKAKLPSKCEPYWSKSASKQPDDCVNPWAVCRASLGCRLGSHKEKVK